MTKSISIYLLFILLFSSILLSNDPLEQINTQGDKLKELLKYAYIYHKDSIDVVEKSQAAFEALLLSLDDKSEYYSAEKYNKMKEINSGDKVSTGITQVVYRDTSHVISLDKSGSAYRAGIRTGAKILKINDSTAINKNEYEINLMLEDTSYNNKIKLEYLDLKDRKNIVELELEDLISSSISLSIKIPKTDIIYIKSLKFTEKADIEFYNALDTLNAENSELIIIDLRDNPGGVLDKSVNVISNFIEEGKVIISTESKHPDFQFEMKSEKTNLNIYGKPLIILVNNISASASELFAGAIQDYDLGLVIGQKTYGKGTIQKFWEFKDGSAFRITVGEYLTPLGRRIQLKETNANIDESLMLSNPEIYDDVLKKIREFGDLSNFKVVNSRTGRTLFSTGRIIPDIEMPSDTITLLTNVMQNKRILFDLALRIIQGQGELILEQYPDMMSFCNNYSFNENIYDLIKAVSYEYNTWNDEMFEADKEYIKNLAKARVGQLLYGDDAYHCVRLERDKVFKKALLSKEDSKKLVETESKN